MREQLKTIISGIHFKPTVVYILVGSFFALVSIVFLLVHTSVAITPKYQTTDHAVDQPLKVQLNTSLKSIAMDEIKISPDVQGEWKYNKGGLVGNDSLEFKPKSYFKVNTSYKVTFGKIERLIVGSKTITPIYFKTESAPKILEKGIFSLKDGQSMAADLPIVAELASPNRGLRHIEIQTDPAIELKKTISEDKIYSWKSDGLLPQGQPIKLKVIDTKNNVTLITKSLNVAAEPSIANPIKSQYFTPQDEAIITFNEPIEPSSSKRITFDIAGSGSWRSDTVYAYKPQKVEPGKTYSATVSSGLRSKSGGVLTSDKVMQFSTTGPVVVTSVSPRGSELAQNSQQIKFTFDQAVDRASAQERLSISGGKLTGISWAGNTMIANVIDLGFQQTITATVGAGVRPVGFGLPSNRVYSTTFTTEFRTVRLNAPFFRQQFKGSCAAASLRMILAAKGIGTSDMDIIYRMGYSPRAADRSTDPPTWDDPDEMYVGDVNGSIRDFTGAGPDAGPVAKAARSYGLGASAVTGASPQWIAEQIYAGRMVIFFGAFANTGFTSWQTNSGKTVRMNITSHARLVTGVKGEPSNPVGFWVSDPLSGVSLWSTSSMAANMNLDTAHQAVVVY